ncbi:MAG: hypothetical protein HYU77_13815 [Betaproteobacteria bacterium]|nr:hypothetical protein [Betaproteobacteria bacterium]
MKPSVGRICIAKNIESNGTDEHPAIINRVWGTHDPADGHAVSVNVTVFPDCGGPQSRPSVSLFETREKALAFLETQNGKPVVCFWPDRT